MSIIRGAGGGGGGGKGGDSGGGPRAPIEAPDSLRSKQFARVLDLISEGEVEGLVNGLQSIYLDDTPLANADGTFNFTGVRVGINLGTQVQNYLPVFSQTESETAVSVEILQAVSVTRQISNTNVDKLRITLGVPQLTAQNQTTGDLTGASIEIGIDLQANGGGFVEQDLAGAEIISGKTTTRYQRNYEIALTGSAPWDIRIRRVTADSVSASLINKTFWESYTEIIDSKLTYPNSVVIGIEIDASQFNAVPRRGYEMNGIKISVPSNYDPDTRIYTGVWDGTFQTLWSDNPAWCFYDLLTKTRYGLGTYLDATLVDKWALYDIGQYCDELVNDGFGGEEPRFTCNLYLQTRDEAFKVIANMAAIFRGMAYWGSGALTAVADMPSDAVTLYTAANVTGGQFSYQGSAKNTRHTVALVVWNDPADAYRQKIEYVEDLVGITRYGVVEAEVVAFGCTSRGQAHRLGRWLLYSERLETETCSFSVGLDGLFSAPGAIIKTQDQARAGLRFGGRVVSATVSAVTIDNAVTIETGKTYTLSTLAPDGTVIESGVDNVPGPTTVLSMSPDLSEAPQAQAIWVLRSDVLVPETWRVLAVTESGKAQFQIIALKHNVDKFDAVENNIILEAVPTSVITTRPAAVTNLTVTDSLFEISAGVVSNRSTLSWTGDTGSYRISYRAQLGNLVVLPPSLSQTIDIDGLTPDIYTFSVVQINALGIAGTANTLTTAIYGKTALPFDITGFSVIATNGRAEAAWDRSPDLDVRVGGHIIIRHSPLTTGATWQDGIVLDTFDGNAVIGSLALITGTYMAKAVDSTGNYSDAAASFVATEGMVTGFTTVGTITEAPTFTGAKTNLVVASSKLELDAGFTSGSYDFANVSDLTTVAVRRYEADIVALSIDNGNTWDSHTEDFDDVDGMWDGAVVNDCDVTLYAATTNDNPAGSPTWSAWTPFMVADFNSRAAKFKLDFISGSVNHNIQVSTLTVHAKVPV